MGFFPPPLPAVGAEERACQDAWRAAAGRCVGTPAPAGATNLCRQAGQAPAELLPVSHRYTPSQRAPHFLYHSITPKGCVRQAHPLLSSFSQTLTAPTGTNPALCWAKRLRKKLHISRTAMSCLLFPVLIYDKRKVIRAMKIQSCSSTLASSDREVNAAKCRK